MKAKLLIVILFGLISCGKSLHATKYYVSNDGDDNNDGLSELTPWQTISKVNAQTFLPGDSILFRCGDIWRMKTLILSSSGNRDNYIVYSSYGKGDKPKFYGSKVLESYLLHSSKKNVYEGEGDIPINPINYNSKNYRGSIFFSLKGTTVWGDGILDYRESIDQLNRNFEWTWKNNKIYFYYDGEVSDISSIECTQLDRGIDIGSEYLAIDGIEMKYWGSRCIGTSIYPEYTVKGMLIRNCELAYTAAKEEGVGYGVALFHSDMIIENNVVHNNGRRNISINITNGTNAVTMRDVTIQDNELYEGFHTTGIDMGIRGNNHTIRNIILRRNKIWEPYGVNKGEFASQFIFLYNHGSLEVVDSIFIYNNLFMNVNSSGVFCRGIKNLYIVNNSFTGPATVHNSGAFIYSSGSNNGNHTILNNIFLNYNGKALTAIDGSKDGSTTLVECDYNLFSAVNNSAYGAYIMFEIDGGKYKYTDWERLKSKGYGMKGPRPQFPHFVDSLNNLRLKESSPAIGTAKPVSFIKTDIEGNLRDSMNPDIGAYEF